MEQIILEVVKRLSTLDLVLTVLAWLTYKVIMNESEKVRGRKNAFYFLIFAGCLAAAIVAIRILLFLNAANLLWRPI